MPTNTTAARNLARMHPDLYRALYQPQHTPARISRGDLFALLATDGTARVCLGGHVGILQSIEREDGSGRSFNVSLALPNGSSVTVYVRTTD